MCYYLGWLKLVKYYIVFPFLCWQWYEDQGITWWCGPEFVNLKQIGRAGSLKRLSQVVRLFLFICFVLLFVLEGVRLESGSVVFQKGEFASTHSKNSTELSSRTRLQGISASIICFRGFTEKMGHIYLHI